MPPKYIVGYYYIHNPLLVNSLCQEESGWPPPHPHPTTEEVSDMNQECQPKGRRKKRELVHIPEVSRTDSAGNNPWALNSMLLIPKGYIISSSSSNSIKIRNMLKPTSSCLVQFWLCRLWEWVCCAAYVATQLCSQNPKSSFIAVDSFIVHNKQQQQRRQLIDLRSSSFVCWIVVEGFIFTSSPFVYWIVVEDFIFTFF